VVVEDTRPLSPRTPLASGTNPQTQRIRIFFPTAVRANSFRQAQSTHRRPNRETATAQLLRGRFKFTVCYADAGWDNYADLLRIYYYSGGFWVDEYSLVLQREASGDASPAVIFSAATSSLDLPAAKTAGTTTSTAFMAPRDGFIDLDTVFLCIQLLAIIIRISTTLQVSGEYDAYYDVVSRKL